MAGTNDFQEAARAYAASARDLFGPGAGEVEGATRAVRSPQTELATRAESFLPLSTELTRLGSARLEDFDAAVRLDASSRLLAKALSDLEVSRRLLRTARDEELGGAATRGAFAAPELLEIDGVNLDESLDLLLGEETLAPPPATRGVIAVTDLAEARRQLTTDMTRALDLIQQEATRTGQAAVASLIGLGMTEVVQAAGIVGLDIARALGHAETVTRLYGVVRELALNAYNSVLALLGPGLAQTVAAQVVNWAQEVTHGEQFGRLVGKLYDTRGTGEYLGQVITASQAELARFADALEGVDQLSGKYLQQAALAQKLLRGFQLVGTAAVAALPQGRLFLAAAYIVTGGYVVVAGADFVDSQRLKLINRIPGVRQLIETQMATG